jgi:2,4-dienoyl-CoA reductase-like NADH-dependent reductase (Old Yellow Enzyme family)
VTVNTLLFSPLALRDLTIPNRVFVSPMCQYSSRDGFPTDWHLVHLGSRAVGGAGLVMTEATAVSPEGRISPGDAGLWSDDHAEAYRPIVEFIAGQGAVPAIQIAHAGRKGSTDAPWRGAHAVPPEQGGWQPEAPSALALTADHPVPRVLETDEVAALPEQFAATARRALNAGFQVAELHMAHGYLMHSFLSPLSNRREDRYGGSLENRMRAPLEVAAAVREVWPQEWPVFVRISATDWVEGGWEIEQSIVFARELQARGIDFIDVSSGGLVPDAKIPVGAGYQVEFAARIRAETGMPTGAVGLITEPFQAEQILRTGQADAVLLARELLRDPYWPRHAARMLGEDIPFPPQYQRAQRR